MSAIQLAAKVGRAQSAAEPGAAGWLRLAAAPTFALMALLTAGSGGGMPDMLCSTALDGSLLGGMIPMYLLMTVFHSPPWLTLITSRRRGPAARLVPKGRDGRFRIPHDVAAPPRSI